jgi:hypothetical protein
MEGDGDMRSSLKPRTAAAVLLILGATAAPATAATPEQMHAAAAKGTTWIGGQQTSSGSLGGFGGDWAMSALAAGGVHPADVKTAVSAPSAQDYDWSSRATTTAGPGGTANDAARATLAGAAGGIQPSRLSATRNLVSQIAGLFDSKQIGDPGLVNDDIFGTLAFQRVGAPEGLLRSRADWVASKRTPDGGFSWATTATTADPDMTGAALAALCAGGRTQSDPVVAGAIAYLRSRQAAATGAITAPSFGANSDTTAWVVSGLNACGIDANSPQWTTTQGKTPADFLVSQQNADGSFQYRAGDRTKNLYSTQSASRALAGQAFSAPTPARSAGPVLRPAPTVAAGTLVPLTLVVDPGSGGTVTLCEVQAPVGGTVADLLNRAVTSSRPAGCVTAWTRGSGPDRVVTVNGASEGGGSVWRIQRDGGPTEQAPAGVLSLGQLVSLRLAP